MLDEETGEGREMGSRFDNRHGKQAPSDPVAALDRERGLSLCPVTISDAREFVRQHHRHHQPPVGGLFAVAAQADGVIVAVAIIGRPVARKLQNGYTAEVTRLCSTGTRNACSMLYAAAWRAARAMGYLRLVTYTLDTEPGTTLKAAGWRVVGETPGRSWSCPSRPRVEKHPLQRKMRWEAV